jgi:hypothetical protein
MTTMPGTVTADREAARPTAFSGDQIDLDLLFDLETYPIHRPGGARCADIIARARSQLDRDGCAVLRNFVTPSAVKAMREEALRLLPRKTMLRSLVNPYFTKDDPTLDARDVRRFFELKSSSFINSDELEGSSFLRLIYDSDVLINFLSGCLGVSPIFRWADPLARNPYGVMETGDYFPWHFDGNDFTVSILVQESGEGGVFEYAPGIRGPDRENRGAVSDVLHGDRTRVTELPLNVGDLQLFKGRYALHRVTRVTGTTPRIIALPTYVTDPYRVNTPVHSEILYGRSLPIHRHRQACDPFERTDEQRGS